MSDNESLQHDIVPINIEDELKKSYLDYAMSVIVGRALPDVCDGLKPVHRRVLYTMHQLNNDYQKPYKKSARIVGDVIGKYHPHGDSSVYDALVRLAQHFSMRYPLIDGQGNFGSVDGDMPAAMRYTEVRMSKITAYMLADIEKDTVDFSPNYDDTEFQPDLLPAMIPNLLINGSSGIAVGMATNIPPHNITEVLDAHLAYIEDPEITISDLVKIIPGPDFPTGAIISGQSGIYSAYTTGKGRVVLRGKYHIETSSKSKKETLVFTEIPYQVNKARLLEKIADLVKQKKIDGISELRDESDKDGMRIVIEVKRGFNAEILVNNLYAQTPLQSVFGMNMIALVNKEPTILDLKSIIRHFIDHRVRIVTRRTLFDLAKSRARSHILEGLLVCLASIDQVIALIKSSRSPNEAKAKLRELKIATSNIELIESEFYNLSEKQASAILEMKLQRLTALEQDKIIAEYKELQDKIKKFLLILSDRTVLMGVIKTELENLKDSFADPRKTVINEAEDDLTNEDLIEPEEVAITMSEQGYVKIQALDQFDAQRRGGKGKIGATFKETDLISNLIVANTKDTILCFSNLGQLYWLKVYQLPRAGRSASGKPIINLLPLSEGERITAILPLKKLTNDSFILMATRCGYVKKVRSADFSRPRSSGIRAIELAEEDSLIGVDVTYGDCELMLISDSGKAIRFHEDDIRATGRTSRGVNGIKLDTNHSVVSLIIIREAESTILTVASNGLGKQTCASNYSKQSRYGVGVYTMDIEFPGTKIVSAIQIHSEDELLLISSSGNIVRLNCSDISVTNSRKTKGVKLINLGEDDSIISAVKISIDPIEIV